MSTKIYVGNLPWRTTEEQLGELFVPYGEVISVRIVSDRETGRSRGFAFVTISTAEGAKAAIAALNGSLLGGRALVVNEANDQGSRPAGSGGPRRTGPRPAPDSQS